jgi:hypothetical protein
MLIAMELEEFLEQYKLKNPGPNGTDTCSRIIYDVKLCDITRFFEEMQKASRTDSMDVETARLVVLAYDHAYNNGLMFRKGVLGIGYIQDISR